jgi:hypothetical protein
MRGARSPRGDDTIRAGPERGAASREPVRDEVDQALARGDTASVFGSAFGPWRLRDHFGEEWSIELLDPADARQEEPATPRELHAVVDHLVFQSFAHGGAIDDEIAGVLLRVHDALTGGSLSLEASPPSADPRRVLVDFDRELRDVLLSALGGQRLRIERVPQRPWPFLDVPDSTPPPPLYTPVEEQTTFIGIVLVDQNGNPVPGRLYRITLPDGSVQDGRLDSQGTARVDGLSPGTCKIDFLELDKVDFSGIAPLPGGRQPGVTGPVVPAPASDAARASTPVTSSSAAPAAGPDHIVHHTFLDARGSPIANISWQLTTSDGSIVGDGVTDSTGIATCAVSAPGDYVLSYDYAAMDGTPDVESATGVDVTEDYSSP